jgi:hypothetical protein
MEIYYSEGSLPFIPKITLADTVSDYNIFGGKYTAKDFKKIKVTLIVEEV